MDSFERKRENALDRIAGLYASGTLEDGEYERIATLISGAGSEGEIESVIAGLPQRKRETATSYPQAHPSQSIVAFLGERKLRGDWVTAEYVTVTVVLGQATLDLTEVVLTRPLRIHAVVVMGELKVRVPAGVPFRNEMTAVLGEVNDSATGTPEARPGITLTGIAALGEVNAGRR